MKIHYYIYAITKEYNEDFVDEDTMEVVSITRTEIIGFGVDSVKGSMRTRHIIAKDAIDSYNDKHKPNRSFKRFITEDRYNNLLLNSCNEIDTIKLYHYMKNKY